MLGFSLVCLVALAQASNTVPPEIDQLNNLSLDDFEDYFGFDHITDPVERARREAVLKENEDMVKKANEAYINGEQTWFEKINEFADLPKDEGETHRQFFERLNSHIRRHLTPANTAAAGMNSGVDGDTYNITKASAK